MGILPAPKRVVGGLAEPWRKGDFRRLWVENLKSPLVWILLFSEIYPQCWSMLTWIPRTAPHVLLWPEKPVYYLYVVLDCTYTFALVTVSPVIVNYAVKWHRARMEAKRESPSEPGIRGKFLRWGRPLIPLIVSLLVLYCGHALYLTQDVLFTRFFRIPYPLWGKAVEMFLTGATWWLAWAFAVNSWRWMSEQRLGADEALKVAHQKILAAQLHPHALFNALAEISALIATDPETAERATEGLATYMHQAAKLTGVQWHTLGEERALVEHYLAFHLVGGTMNLEWEWDATLDGRLVPPLVLQPLVENAIKHGAGSSGVLKLMARQEGDHLVLAVGNPLTPKARERKPSGIGLRNLRERLALAYQEEASLDLHVGEAWAEAVLRVRTA